MAARELHRSLAARLERDVGRLDPRHLLDNAQQRLVEILRLRTTNLDVPAFAAATSSPAVFQGASGRVQSRNSSKASAATGVSSSRFQPTFATIGNSHWFEVPKIKRCGSPAPVLP